MAKRKTSTPTDTRPPFNPFLKASDLSRGPNKLHLTGWVRELIGKYGPQIVIEVRDAKEHTYDFAIGKGSANHRVLFKALGVDIFKWAGTITVEAQKGRNVAEFVAVVTADSTEAPF